MTQVIFFVIFYFLPYTAKLFTMETAKLLHWTARGLCIAAILFVSIFALDAFNPNLSVWQQIGSFIKHLAPSFILVFILAIAWKWELAGGILFSAIGISMMFFIYFLNHDRNQFTVEQSIINAMIICLPFVVAGVLFILSYYKSRRVG